MIWTDYSLALEEYDLAFAEQEQQLHEEHLYDATMLDILWQHDQDLYLQHQIEQVVLYELGFDVAFDNI
jgi:hypothetical protein